MRGCADAWHWWDRTDRYCGEPDVARCELCVGPAGSLIDEEISVAALRQSLGKTVVAVASECHRPIGRCWCRESAGIFLPCDQWCSRTRMMRRLMILRRSRQQVGAAFASSVLSAFTRGSRCLLDCALDAAARNLPVEFVVVGHTINDRALLATGRVFVTGPYRGRRGSRADQGPEREPCAAAVDFSRDVVPGLDRGVACGAARRCLRHRSSG